MHRKLQKTTEIRKNQRNMFLQKKYSKPLVTGHREMEIRKLRNKEFKIIIIQIL